MAGHGLGLVRLQVADQVPFQRQVLQRLHLGQCLLHVVLAEGVLALRGQRGHGLGRLGLGHRQQAWVGPASGLGGGMQVAQDLGRGVAT